MHSASGSRRSFVVRCAAAILAVAMSADAGANGAAVWMVGRDMAEDGVEIDDPGGLAKALGKRHLEIRILGGHAEVGQQAEHVAEGAAVDDVSA